jgi:hypothetical protein
VTRCCRGVEDLASCTKRKKRKRTINRLNERVDEKLTEPRDEGSVTRIDGTRQRGSDQWFWRSGALTSGSRGLLPMLDAEEARGSNPLAPTKIAVQRPFSVLMPYFRPGKRTATLTQRERICR